MSDVPTLVVDDQADIRLLMKVLIDMANEGLRVAGEACSGTEALERAAEIDPLVVIMDEMMPGMDGVETVSRMRATRPAQIVILCSAYLDDDVIARARKAGILHCLPKSRVDELPRVIRAAIAAQAG